MARIFIDKYLIKTRVATRYKRHKINALRNKIKRLQNARDYYLLTMLSEDIASAIARHKKAIRRLGKKG